MRRDDAHPPAWSRALPAVVLAAAFAHNLSRSWMRWGNVLVDGGRELEWPQRMLDGERLYVDLRYVYGPLAPYVNMALYRLFGVHASVLLGAGLVTAALTCWLVYRLSREFAGAVASTAVATMFLYVCAFPQLYSGGGFNFVLPYAYAATYGIAAAIGSLLLLIVHQRSGATRAFVASVALLAATALLKAEILVPAAAAHVVFVADAVIAGRLSRRHLTAYSVAAIAVASVYGALAARAGAALWTDNLAVHVNPGLRYYTLDTTGFADVGASLRAIAGSCLALGGAIATGFALAWIARVRALGPFARAACAAVAALVTATAYAHVHAKVSLRALPVAIVVMAVILVRRYANDRRDRAATARELLLWTFGAACLSRTWLNTIPHHYGFYLLPVPLVCLCVLLLEEVPRAARSVPRTPIRLAALGVLVGVTIPISNLSAQFYGLHLADIRAPRGHLWTIGHGYERRVIQLLSALPPETRVLVVPEGEGLLFFSGARPADGLFSHLPFDLWGEHEARVLARWKAAPPDVVVWVEAPDRPEFGFKGFGVDYAVDAGEWIRQHYRPVLEFRGGATLLQRVGSSALDRAIATALATPGERQALRVAEAPFSWDRIR